jgi:hypothetical protein
MPSPVLRRLVSPILSTTQARRFLTLPVGSIIETSDSLDEPGLHSVRLGNEELFAFTRDIEERSERIDSSAASEEVVVREDLAGRS